MGLHADKVPGLNFRRNYTDKYCLFYFYFWWFLKNVYEGDSFPTHEVIFSLQVYDFNCTPPQNTIIP